MKINKMITALAATSLLSLSSVSSFAAPQNAPVQSAPTQNSAQMPAPSMTEKAGVAMDDSMITANVKSKLAMDPDVSSMKISVVTTKGVVVLSGSVPNNAASTYLVKLVSNVEGVKSVDNKTQIKAS
jgi:hyperosmotically inducible protein